MTVSICVTINTKDTRGRRLLAPTGITTPSQMPAAFDVEGGAFSLIFDQTTGQAAALIMPDASGQTVLNYEFEHVQASYPESMFKFRETRYTRAAKALVADARAIADRHNDGHAAIAAIANDTAEKFSYGHPSVRFYDGHDEIPHLGCGTTEGSCVDINTYFIAALRAAGFEASYVYGYFFPAEKGGHASDGHCWVVSRHQGVTLEWDIAHHLKMGTRAICCGLNPKPGHRVACSHSMGLSFPTLGVADLKILGEALWVDDHGTVEFADLTIFSTESQNTAA